MDALPGVTSKLIHTHDCAVNERVSGPAARFRQCLLPRNN
jgi:hypothetical protein